MSTPDLSRARPSCVSSIEPQADACLDDVAALYAEAEARYGAHLRERIIRRLVEDLDRDYRSTPRIQSEEAAMALIKGMASELTHAAQALYRGAEAVKRRGGLGALASELHHAAKRADRAAQELVRG